ncbi:MAG: universal stress protein [Bacteroidetes bacterium]|nr:universal stress protein [Bacteroidota bacterium]
MKPIIIATDFSAASQNAARYAADMAVTVQSEIILVHVYEIPISSFQVPISEIEFTALEDDAKANLADLKKGLEARTNGKINISTQLLYGTVQTELEKFLQSKSPFAVVAGSKTQTNLERFVVGSNVTRLMHHLRFPVLMVPEHLAFKGIHRIAIASDLSSTSENSCIGFIKKWLNVFHVSPDIIHFAPLEHPKYNTAAGIAFLKNTLAAFEPSFHFISNRDIEEGINDFLSSHKTDLLIVMPGKHGFWESLLNKSFSKELIVHASLPVLSVLQNDQVNGTHKHYDHSCKKCDGNCKSNKEMKNFIDEAHSQA